MAATDPDVDPDALLDRLIAADVVDEADDGELTATTEFESAHAVYRDSYLELGDEEFRRSVADVFDIDGAEAADRIEELGVTRAELAAYLTLQSFLEEPPGAVELATMAAMVVEVAPPSPVPDGQRELEDEDYEAFLAEHERAVVFVWKRDCVPCERMKDDLDELLAELPEDHAVAGVDGGAVGAFRREFEITAAPTTLRFADGELVARAEGRLRADGFADLLERAFGEN
ncbi:thioredoxin family protein [Halorarum halobium]|uniref:thioredoxin family protein n=1 Tax=Halorarum halobium TaxID=3075121 RepID=UPI0028ABDF27|nr:thioredoxin family protein [Halobaculum sp. XH14]